MTIRSVSIVCIAALALTVAAGTVFAADSVPGRSAGSLEGRDLAPDADLGVPQEEDSSRVIIAYYKNRLYQDPSVWYRVRSLAKTTTTSYATSVRACNRMCIDYSCSTNLCTTKYNWYGWVKAWWYYDDPDYYHYYDSYATHRVVKSGITYKHSSHLAGTL